MMGNELEARDVTVTQAETPVNVTFRLQIEVRDRKGVSTEIWTKTEPKMLSVGLDPMVLVYDYEGFGACSQSVMRFILDTYDAENAIATYKERSFRRSDENYKRLSYGWGFKREA